MKTIPFLSLLIIFTACVRENKPLTGIATTGSGSTKPINFQELTVKHDSLAGSGANTVLKKCKGFRSPFALDADYGELQITVADASGFKPGMGVAIYDETQRSGWDLTTARITGIKGNVIYIDDYLLRDYHADKKGTLSNSCSVISAVDANNVRIANLTVDGSRECNDMIDGCRAGGIYLHKVHKAIVENVTVKNFNCDGISW